MFNIEIAGILTVGASFTITVGVYLCMLKWMTDTALTGRYPDN